MAWVVLLAAGLFEVVWASTLKLSEGFTRLWPTVATVIAAGFSFWLLAIAMKTLPLGTSYAVFTGLGAAGAFVLGIAVFGEALTVGRVVSVTMIIGGIVGLKLTSG